MSWDLVLQGAQQSFCDRSMLFHSEPSLGVFPPNFGTEIGPLGDATTKGGRSLVFIRNVNRSPKEILAWYTSSAIMMRYTTRFYLFPTERKPADSVADLVAALIAGGPPPGPLRLQCNPRSLETTLGTLLPLSFRLHPVEHSHVLDVVEADGKFRYGIRSKGGFFCRTWNTVKPAETSCSRAKYKLQEVFDMLRLSFPPGAAAIDIGAAPGGWTDLLVRDKGMHVYAVDPASLDPAVAALQGVTHIKKVAESACEELLQLLGAPSVSNGLGEHGSQNLQAYNGGTAGRSLPNGLGLLDSDKAFLSEEDKQLDNATVRGPGLSGHHTHHATQIGSDSSLKNGLGLPGSLETRKPNSNTDVVTSSPTQRPSEHLTLSDTPRLYTAVIEGASALSLSNGPVVAAMPRCTTQPPRGNNASKACQPGRQLDATSTIQHGTGAGGGAVLLVCDMNCHPGDAVPAIKPLISCVAPGGWLVVTLKFFGLGRDKSKWHARVAAMVGRECIQQRMLWCYANSDYERTFVAQMR